VLFIHPFLQALATLLAFYVFYLGIQRFRSRHLHQKVVFKWQRHVLLGKIVFGVLFIGMLGGFFMVYTHWHRILITRIHTIVGLVLAALIIIGFGTGLSLDAKKKKHRFLPLFHGINNLIVLLLLLSQAISGWMIL
jgi:hypothetical protein